MLAALEGLEILLQLLHLKEIMEALGGRNRGRMALAEVEVLILLVKQVPIRLAELVGVGLRQHF
jgi:hypothetical protein